MADRAAMTLREIKVTRRQSHYRDRLTSAGTPRQRLDAIYGLALSSVKHAAPDRRHALVDEFVTAWEQIARTEDEKYARRRKS